NTAFNMGQLMSNSLLAIYADSLGASASAIGLVISAFSISSILFRFISAPIMDTYNRKYIVVLSTLLLAGAFWGFSISGSIQMLLAFRLMQGCGMAFGNACCLAMVADMLPKDKYATGIGYYSMAQVVSQAIGPSVGLWLGGMFGYKMTFVINSCVMLLAAFLAMQIKLEFKQTKKLKLSLNNIIAKEALIPAGVMLLLITGTITTSFLIVFAASRGVTQNIGLYFTVSAVTMLATRPIIGKMTDKYGLTAICIPALFSNVLCFFIISYSSSLGGFLLAAFVSAFGSGACQPAMQALSLKAVTPDRRGAASSTNYIGMDLGNLIGPTIAGNIAQSIGYVPMWRIMVFPFLIGILVLFLTRKRIAAIEEGFASEA
ncbi:MAG: MFS transporter, partial [Clostridiales bacterium]|nr:MFS transporter [Clostridiales bacterium]